MISPAAARNHKRLLPMVLVSFSDGREVAIKEPSLQAWLGYANNEGGTPATNPVIFTDHGITVTIYKGAKRP